MKDPQIRARWIYDEREIIRDISLFKFTNQLVNERLGTDIDDSSKKTEIHVTMSNIDNYTE